MYSHDVRTEFISEAKQNVEAQEYRNGETERVSHTRNRMKGRESGAVEPLSRESTRAMGVKTGT